MGMPDILEYTNKEALHSLIFYSLISWLNFVALILLYICLLECWSLLGRQTPRIILKIFWFYPFLFSIALSWFILILCQYRNLFTLVFGFYTILIIAFLFSILVSLLLVAKTYAHNFVNYKCSTSNKRYIQNPTTTHFIDLNYMRLHD